MLQKWRVARNFERREVRRKYIVSVGSFEVNANFSIINEIYLVYLY